MESLQCANLEAIGGAAGCNLIGGMPVQARDPLIRVGGYRTRDSCSLRYCAIQTRQKL
jgi:hypothetical protein